MDAACGEHRTATVARGRYSGWRLDPREAALWGHSANAAGARHRLVDHLRGTGRLSRQFGEAFGAGDLCEALGLLHDAGKAAPEWQRRLLEVESRSGRGGQVGVPHKQLGTRLLTPRAGPASVCVLGHHGGLEDYGDFKKEALAPLTDDEEGTRAALVAEVPEVAPLLAEPEALLPATWRSCPLVLEMGTRLAFSALVDADHLDTAAHFDCLDGPRVRDTIDMAALLARFEAQRAALLAGRTPSPIDDLRAEVYDAAIAAAAGGPGIYRLPAPTGAGKTMTAAAFGLHHAVRHGKARVIVAVPYITITEQNAAVYRSLLGQDAVLEHHSAVELDQRRARLGAENWDSPFVVTTTVQLFDSLFGRKPSRSRKVHRLANAVVVLDEVQALPADLLLPILDALRLLSEHFGTTVLLTSATQPSFQRLSVWAPLQERITEIIPEPARLYERLRRVRYEWRLGDPAIDLAGVAEEIAGHEQALIVVNTVADARRMYRLLTERDRQAVRHLSTRMCPAHRRHVLEEVRSLLGEGRPVALVSTQLIEAGVDVDFPVVFRALAPADSLQQAAGRANREGRRTEDGLVVVFEASDAPVPRFYRTAVDQTRVQFGPDKCDPDDLAALDRYYAGLYDALNLEGARHGRTIQANREGRNYRSVADGPLRDAGLAASSAGGRDKALAFRMLDDDSVQVVISSYAGSTEVGHLLTALRAGEGSRPELYRALQPYIVALPAHIADHADVRALTRPVIGDLLEWVGEYDPGIGIDDGNTVSRTVW
jgi:CRISPR-associated endonuclease/helicase Cas3